MRCRKLAILVSLVLAACNPQSPQDLQGSLYILRLDPLAFVQLGADLRPVREVPLSLPSGCGLAGLFPSPRGLTVALELSCAFGPATLWLDADTGALRQGVTDSDSHFLAWDPDGQAMYLRVNTVNAPRILRLGLDGRKDELPISELTYDLAPSPGGDQFIFSYSRGMGLGSEMWLAERDGRVVRRLLSDANNYLALARWSPDAGRIAFVRIQDTATPFTVGELWVMARDGSRLERLAQADAGHGFAPAWAPDGERIAFVYRENPDDPHANQSSSALLSNLWLVDLRNPQARSITHLDSSRVEPAVWEPDGRRIAFTAASNDRMLVYIEELSSGWMQSIPVEPACCAAWLRP